MDPSLHQISISGPSLTSLLLHFSSSHSDLDGILFGRFTTSFSSRLDDFDDSSSPLQHLSAIITGFCSGGSSRSFYDACGRISPSHLSRLVHGNESRHRDPVIGWFVGRRNTPMRPSIRDMAVMRSLASSAKVSLSCDAASSAERSDTVDNPCALSQTGRIESPTPLPASKDGVRLKWRSQTESGLDDSSATHSQPLSPKGNNVMDRHASPQDSNVCEQLESSNNVWETDVSTSVTDAAAAFSDHQTSPKDAKSKPSLPETCSVSSGGISFQSSSTLLFMLLTESGMGQAIHTHDYRVYQYHFQSQIFEPKILKIINIGPVSRGQYDAFSPIAHFPLFRNSINGENEDYSHNHILTKANDGTKNASVPLQNEQTLMDMYSEGYKVDGLTRLIKPDGMQQVRELEDLYSKMLLKLESLAKQVSDSSSQLLQQEMRNSQLRQKVSGHK